MPGSPNTELLRTKPLEFMKRFAVSPPAGAGARLVPGVNGAMGTFVNNQTTSPSIDIYKDTVGAIKGSDVMLNDTITGFRVTKGGVVQVQVVPVARDKPGAMTFDISMVPSDDRVPIHFLPWNSMSLVDMKLRDVGADFDDPDNPNLFFTTALSGCSVFVDGHPARPRVVHAGIDGKLTVEAGAFWEERFHELARLRGQPVDDHLRSISKSRYMGTAWGIGYRNWLESEYRDELKIKAIDEWASVFGIRYGRLWSFYLQKCATVTTIRAVKRSDVTRTKSTNGKTYSMNGAPVEKTTVKTGRFSKQRIYTFEETWARPIAIEEFYPNKSNEGGAVISVKNRYAQLY